MNNDKTVHQMEQVPDAVTKLLDVSSGTALVAGIFAGIDILTLLGSIAAIASIINHVDQYFRRKRNDRK